MSHVGNWARNPRKLALERERAAERAREAQAALHTPSYLLMCGHQVTLTCTKCSRAEPADLLAFEVAGLGDRDLRELVRLMRCEKERGGCGRKGQVVVGVKR